MKPSLFIGSSSEALPVAEAAQRAMRHVADVTIWTQGVFGLNRTAFETIVNTAKYYDYAVFIMSEDDDLLLRGSEQKAVRDNVIFELGFFCAALGTSRCFFMIPKSSNKFRIPSDLSGVMYASYDLSSHKGNIDPAIGSACSEIISEIRSPGPLTGDWNIFIEGYDHSEPNGVFSIIHAGSKVTASLSLLKGRTGEFTERHFVYEGRYLSGQIVLHFEQRGAEDHIVGSTTIRVLSNMREMRGVTSYWHHEEATLVNERFSLRRTN